MLTRRLFTVIAAATILVGCSNITAIERAQKETGPLQLVDVIVDVSDVDVTTRGRSINKTTAELQQDLRQAVTAEAQKRSVPGGVPANVNVEVEEVFLARLTDRVLAGTSYIESEISITNAETGEFIVEPVTVRANAEQLRGPGPVGAATAVTTTTDADYKNVVAAYARALLASLDASS